MQGGPHKPVATLATSAHIERCPRIHSACAHSQTAPESDDTQAVADAQAASTSGGAGAAEATAASEREARAAARLRSELARRDGALKAATADLEGVSAQQGCRRRHAGVLAEILCLALIELCVWKWQGGWMLSHWQRFAPLCVAAGTCSAGCGRSCSAP